MAKISIFGQNVEKVLGYFSAQIPSPGFETSYLEHFDPVDFISGISFEVWLDPDPPTASDIFIQNWKFLKNSVACRVARG